MNLRPKTPGILSAGLMLMLLAVMLVVWRPYSNNPEPSGPRASSAPSIALPTTNSANAADSYRQAVGLIQALGSADQDQLEQYESGKIDARAADFFDRHAAILAWVHMGAAQPECDWGEAVIGKRLTSLNGLREIARFTWAHSQFAEQSSNASAAVDDLLSAMALARHIGTNRLLVDVLVQIGIENHSVELLASVLPKLSRDQLKPLAERLDALPNSITGRQLLLGEFDHAQRSIREQQAGFVAVSMVDSMKGFYTDLGAAIDTQSPDEFAKTVDAQMNEYKHNTFAQTLGPTLKRFRETTAVLQERQAMLRCAIGVLAEGESAVARWHDPFGDAAPFTYTRTASGFTLTSKLTRRGAPITLTVGGQ